MKTLYLKPAARRQCILEAAVAQAKEKGFHTITRASVAARIGCEASLVNRYFHPVAKLRDEVMLQAVANAVLCVLAEGLAMRHPAALGAPAALRAAAALSLSGQS